MSNTETLSVRYEPNERFLDMAIVEEMFQGMGNNNEARRSDIVTLAQQMFVTQCGHHGGFWMPNVPAQQHEVYRKMAREALSAAEAFIIESRKETEVHEP